MADDALDFHVFDTLAAAPNRVRGPIGVSGWQR